MTKLILTIVADTSMDALNVLEKLTHNLLKTDPRNRDPLKPMLDAESVSMEYGNGSCDVFRFDPVEGSAAEITQLATAFITKLTQEIGEDLIEIVCSDNKREPNSNICHSHDFCDANMVMLDAWNECFPHEEFSAQNTRHADLWNAAWSMAKQRQFSV